MYADTVKKEALRLRQEERRSLKDISEKLGVAKSTTSLWLRDCPLSKEELQERKRVGGKNSQGSKATRIFVKSPLRKLAARGLTQAQKAKISEAAVLLRLLVRGYDVYGSFFDGDKFDWLVYVPATDKVHKLQIKSVQLEKGTSYQFIPLRRNKGRTKVKYKPHEVDFFIVYDLMTDIAYVYSFREVRDVQSTVKTTEEAAERWDKLEK